MLDNPWGSPPGTVTTPVEGWQICSCPQMSQQLVYMLQEGWEPFAATTYVGGTLYHLRRRHVYSQPA